MHGECWDKLEENLLFNQIKQHAYSFVSLSDGGSDGRVGVVAAAGGGGGGGQWLDWMGRGWGLGTVWRGGQHRFHFELPLDQNLIRFLSYSKGSLG